MIKETTVEFTSKDMSADQFDRKLKNLCVGAIINVTMGFVVMLAGAGFALNIIEVEIPRHLTAVIITLWGFFMYLLGRKVSGEVRMMRVIRDGHK